MTEAEYTQKTGRVLDWMPTLPALDFAESLVVVRSVSTIQAAGQTEVDQAIARRRSSGSGPRGAYVTRPAKEELMTQIDARQVDSLKPAGVSDAVWKIRLEKNAREFAAAEPTTPQREVGLWAGVTLAARMKKRGA